MIERTTNFEFSPKLKCLVIGVLLLLFHSISIAQTVFFSENVGTPAATTPVATYTGWENTTPVTFSGNADVRTTTPSTGYTGASASGNVYFAATAGNQLTISGINSSAYSAISLSLGHYKSTTTGNNELIIEVSSDGSTFTPLTYTRPTGAGTASWILITPTGSIPAVDNLRIRFRQTSTTTQFRIDDIKLTGVINPCQVTVTSFTPVSGPVGTLVKINGTNFTGATEVKFNGISQTVFTFISSTEIHARVPETATSGPISVVSGCAGISTSGFTVINTSCSYTGTNLIISELCDPQGSYQTDRFIEIYNPTNAPVNLTGWQVRAISNGIITALCSNTNVHCWDLSGIIQPGEALTCGNPSPAYGGPHDFTSSIWYYDVLNPNQACYNWNGQYRDGAALYNGSVLIDAILRADLGTAWYSDRSLVRNADICSPSTNSPFTEWTVTAIVPDAGTAPATPGSHTTNCTSVSPVINTHPLTQTVCQNGTVTLTAAATGGVIPYQYVWKVYTGSGTWQTITNNSNYSGATTASLVISNIPLAFNNYQYYCEVFNSGGTCYKATNAMQLTVTPAPSTGLIWHY